MGYNGQLLKPRVNVGFALGMKGVSVVTMLESLSEPHAEGVAVFAPGKVGSNVDVVFSAQTEPGSETDGGKNIFGIEF